VLKLTSEHLLHLAKTFEDGASRVEYKEGSEDSVDNRRRVTRTVHELGDLLHKKIYTETEENELEYELEHFILLS